MIRTALRVAAWGAIVFAALVAVGVAFLFIQAQRKPDTTGQYVALGSSYAAGIGLGPRAPESPIVCMRTIAGYPSILARKLGLSLVDMTCSGSTTAHILRGRQMFLGPQLDAVGPATRLVTITSGGNDVGYVGDLLHASDTSPLWVRLLAGRPREIDQRTFDGVTDNLTRIANGARQRAPRATIVIATYPAIVPPVGSCDALGFDQRVAARARDIGVRLTAATRVAAAKSGAILVEMSAASQKHDVCSSTPWINGGAPASGTPFHPNAEGALAVANAIVATLKSTRRRTANSSGWNQKVAIGEGANRFAFRQTKAVFRLPTMDAGAAARAGQAWPSVLLQ